jgi:small subunit ribosomal protein S6
MSDKNIYEGLFLFPQTATANLQAAHDHLLDLLKRAEAEIVSLCKWDERRLAYEIKGNKRGVYFLTYFHAAPDAVSKLERDCNLSEQLLRSLVTRAELIPQEIIEAADGRSTLADEIKLRGEQEAAPAAAPAAVTKAPAAAPAEETASATEG